MESLVRVRPLDCDFSLEAPERNRDWYEQRGYEPASTALFRTAAAGADVVLDIGAHVGYYSLLGASAAPGAAVVAVEASPENAEVLRRNVEGAGVHVVNAAIAAAAGTVSVQLTEASDNSGLSGHPNSPTERSVEVTAMAAADLDLPPGERLVVKIDVEGHELAALTGMEPLLGRYEDVRLLIEMNPKCLTLAGSSGDELVDRLRGYGLRIFVIDEERRAWHELREGARWQDLVDPARYANLYCVREDRCRTVSAILHSSGVGGAERSHAEMVESLVRQGCMVHTVVPGPDAGLGAEVLRRGGSVTTVPPLAWWALWPHEAQEDPSAWAARALVHVPLLSALESVGADVVVSQSGVVLQGAVAAAALRTPHIWYLREFGDLDHGLVLPDGFGSLVRALSAEVVTNSAAVRDHHLGEDPGVTVLAPAPVLDPEVGAGSADGAPGTDAARLWTVGVVASLNPGKGQDDAVRAVAALRSQRVEVPLVLLGSGTDVDRARLSALADDLGVADLVELAGGRASRAEIYGRLDAVAVTSRAEAFGRIPFEATAAGLPVLYADAGGPAEYMTDGVTGLAYPPGDAEELARVLARLRREPELGEQLVDAARRALLAPGRRRAYDEAVLQVVHRAAAAGGRGPVVELVGALAREAWGNAREAGLWRSELESARTDLSRVVSEHEQLVADHGRLVEGHEGVVAAREAENAAHVARQAELEAEIGASRRANAAMRSEVGDTREEVARLRSDLAALGERLTATEAAYDQVVTSRTWRYRQRAVRALRRG